MSSAAYDAKEKLEAALGIGLEAVKLAIRTDPIAKLIWDHSVALIASLEQNPVPPAIDATKLQNSLEAVEKVYKDGFAAGVDWSQGPYGKGLPNVNEYWRQYPGVNGDVRPAEPLRDMSAEAQAKADACIHSFRYTGTDGHGSHKGEDHYRCVKCGVGEYRHD